MTSEETAFPVDPKALTACSDTPYDPFTIFDTVIGIVAVKIPLFSVNA